VLFMQLELLMGSDVVLFQLSGSLASRSKAS
jgi:hypothetical protein